MNGEQENEKNGRTYAEEREDFKNLASKSEKLHQKEQEMLAATLPELENLKKIFLGSGVVCYDLAAFDNCN